MNKLLLSYLNVVFQFVGQKKITKWIIKVYWHINKVELCFNKCA